MTGPMCGTVAPTGSRACLVSKSPHTGTIFESNIGGAFGPELKFAGFDGIVITGKADHPVYLRIEDGNVSLEDAGPIWGKGIFDTEEYFVEKVNRGTKSLAIGPAGENQVTYRSYNPDKEHITIEIKDSGIGIPAEDLDHIFEPYYQLNRADNPSRGLGLGLSLSKMLIDLHGGDIWVTSQKRKGSTFSFWLPVTKAIV